MKSINDWKFGEYLVQYYSSKNLNATFKNVLALHIELYSYPPAQEPEAAPPFSIHSADVKQVPFR